MKIGTAMERALPPSARRSSGTILHVGIALMLLPGFAGCGKKDPFARQPVRGTVSFEGKPIQYGSINFEPAGGQKSAASAAIADGTFTIPREAGPSPGPYAVWVHAFDRGADPPPGTAPGEEGPPPKEILPEKYRSAPATQIEIREIAEGFNEVKIDLP